MVTIFIHMFFVLDIRRLQYQDNDTECAQWNVTKEPAHNSMCQKEVRGQFGLVSQVNYDTVLVFAPPAICIKGMRMATQACDSPTGNGTTATKLLF
jgi:hypothetical protein